MTLDDLERQNRDFLMDLLADFGLRHKIIHKEVPPSPQFYYHVHFATTAIKVFYFIPNSRIVRFRCIVSAI